MAFADSPSAKQRTESPHHRSLISCSGSVRSRSSCGVLCGLVAVAQAQEPAPPPFFPGARYDAAIPTLKQVVDHEPGQEITTPDQIGTYLQALAKAAPTRTRLTEYARTWEGRPLWVLVIGSADRIAKLDQVQRDLQRLADPRGLSGGDADRLVQSLPVVTWLSHGVHGNEISSGDAALLEAYHLLASQGDADVETVLRESLVLIDPMQNPDGRARFIAQNLQGRAATPDPTPYNAEHDEPWPGGRSNHYLFDMNRDWFAQIAAGDARPHPARAAILAARDRRSPRAGRRQQLLLRAARRSAEPAHHQEPGGGVRPVRPRQRRALRRARLGLLHSRGLRLVLSGLRRVVADLPGLDRDDLRAGLRTQPVLRAERQDGADLSRRRHAPRQRRDRDGDHRGEESRSPAARFSRVPPIGDCRR